MSEKQIGSDGNERWYVRGILHREHGPALVHTDGSQFWYRWGYLHRDDGPAVIYFNGLQRWYQWGKLHRDNGPASLWADGTEHWYRNGKKIDPMGKENKQTSRGIESIPPEVVARMNDMNRESKTKRKYLKDYMLSEVQYNSGRDEEGVEFSHSPESEDDIPVIKFPKGNMMATLAERNKKIIMDLAVEPITMMPVGIGSTILICNWAVQGPMAGFFMGSIAVLMGFGIATTRVLFGWDKMISKHKAAELKLKLEKRNEAIKNLNSRLKRRGDTEGHILLEQVRTLYETFQSNVEDRAEEYSQAGIVDVVERLFEACVDYIERAYELLKTAKKLHGDSKQRIMDRRQDMLNKVQTCVEQLVKTVEQTEDMVLSHEHGELDRMRQNLDDQLSVSQSVANEMREIDDLIRDS